MFDLSIKSLTILNIIIGTILIIHILMTQSALTTLRNKQGPTGPEGKRGLTGVSGACSTR
jgi:hypothetical protein